MVGARGGVGRHCAAVPAGMRCLATEVAHVPRQQVSKIEGDGEMLTGARIQAALTCREVGGDVRR